jgi:hypothetical protein
MGEHDFGIKACMESVAFDVETLHMNPFEELGRAIIRAEQDVFFNKTMIEAWKQYIKENGLKWNDKTGGERE